MQPLCRREARKQDRRDAIIAVAEQSFMENGYAATSMSAIAAAVGGSKATLWSYFPSKESLFEAVLESAIGNYRRELETTLAPSDDLRTTLLGFCRRFMQKICAPNSVQLHRLIAGEAERFPEVGQIFYRRGPRQTQEILAAFFADQMAKGRLRAESPLIAARAITGLCVGWQQRVVWGLPRPSDEELNEEAAIAVDLFLRAFAPPSGDEPPVVG